MNLDLVGTLPLTEWFSLLARVGAQHAWSKDRFSSAGAGGGISSSGKYNDTDVKMGLGAPIEITPSVWIRGDWARYRIENATGRRANAGLATASLVFPFGRAPAPRVAAAPAYMAPAPMPAPVVVAAPMPAPVAVDPAPQRVSFSADTLFGIDKAKVHPEGLAELDKFSQQLGGTTYDSISVEGHTDRKGSDNDHQALSSDRAKTVKDFLVSNGKIDPAKIGAVGIGESSPVTQLDD
ncbi:OmpA family protein [Hydrogenophaga sp. PAMC20947]|uniref:OmpA family protein n=1 Tax=Hydrogenophaga sp. PAMC20947 TaxID=2565558 RepID=UPI00109D9CAB|nr:OmpA family protein [Hydrogenophaga sp. PAMC20947]QCB45425.1 OmpA family protein [Hydrogenophaga sp. PAMC20947]